MQLAGKHILEASRAKVWTLLLNTEVLARIIPGVSRLEKTGENSFRSILDIRLGPVNSSFTGQLQFENIQEPDELTINMQQNSKIGNAKATIKVNLEALESNRTGLAFEANARLTGLLASMGERVLGGVTQTLVQLFFKNIEKELANLNPVETGHKADQH